MLLHYLNQLSNFFKCLLEFVPSAFGTWLVDPGKVHLVKAGCFGQLQADNIFQAGAAGDT